MIGSVQEGLERYKDRVLLLQKFVMDRMSYYPELAKNNSPLKISSAKFLMDSYNQDCDQFKKQKEELQSMEEVLGLSKDEIDAVYRELNLNQNLSSLGELNLTP